MPLSDILELDDDGHRVVAPHGAVRICAAMRSIEKRGWDAKPWDWTKDGLPPFDDEKFLRGHSFGEKWERIIYGLDTISLPKARELYRWLLAAERAAKRSPVPLRLVK